MKKIIIKILIIIVAIFSLTGCWDYVGLDEITIVTGLSIDKSSDDYILNFEIVDLNESTKEKGIITMILEEKGKSIFDAVRNAKKKVMNKLYFSNAEAVIVSKDIVEKEGINAIINWFMRDTEVRDNTALVVSNGENASDILKNNKIDSGSISFEVKEIVENDKDVTASTKNMEIYTAYNLLKSDTKSLVLPLFSIVNNDNKEVPEVTGLAVFKKDKWIGNLTPNESKYYLFIDNCLNGGIVTVNYNSKYTNFDNVSLEIAESKTMKSFSYKDNKFKIKISINTKVYISEYEEQNGNLSESEIKSIKKEAEKKIKKETLKLIDKAKNEYKHDIFGLSNVVYQQDPKLWKKVKKDWNKFFIESDIEIDPEIEILNSVLLK